MSSIDEVRATDARQELGIVVERVTRVEGKDGSVRAETRPDGDGPSQRPDGDGPRRPDGDGPRRPDGDGPRRPDGDGPPRPDGDG